MVTEKELLALKLELSVKAKNGLDFIAAAGAVWTLLAFLDPALPASAKGVLDVLPR